MKRQSLLLSAAMLSAAGVSAQSLPEGMTALLPDGVKANLSQTKHVQEQKNLVVAGSPQKGYYAFFQAADSDHGEELWITDGTPAGTRMVKDINPGVATSNIQYLTRFNDKVVFSADDGENGQEIWISDGTENGTYLLKDIHELDSSNPLAFCQMDENHLVFFAMDFESETFGPNPQQWLWVTDGTEEGTNLVKAVDCIYPGQEEGNNRWGAIMRVGRKVFFKGNEADKDGVTHGVELWVTDGTEAGTFLLKDINIEVDNAKNDGSTLSPALCGMQNFYNEKLFFKAWSIEFGNEPWASDGTSNGTYQICDTRPGKEANGNGMSGSVICVGEPYNGEIVWRTLSETYGHELGATNLEPDNYKVIDIFKKEPTNENNSYPDDGVVFDGLYMFCASTGFDATDPTCHGGELHYYDGEKVWEPINWAPGTGSNWIKEMTVAGGSLYWCNEGSLDGTGATDTKLIRLDSKDSTPVIVSNIDANGDKVYCLRNLNGDLLFTSAVNNQLYCYHFRQEDYDPSKNPDKMEPEYRTRKEIAESSGVKEIGIDNMVISVSPNPAVDKFHINIAKQVENVTVYNSAGMRMMNIPTPENNTVSVNGLGAGVYFVNVMVGGKSTTVKLIVK